MGSEIIPLIFIPVTIFIILTLMFGDHDNSPVIQDVNLMQSLLGSASSRQVCEDTYSSCSNTGCNLITNFPCGDLFYVLLILGTILATPFLAIGIPILLMVGLTSITVFNTTYTLSDIWYFYAFNWGSFILGVSRMIW